MWRRPILLLIVLCLLSWAALGLLLLAGETLAAYAYSAASADHGSQASASFSDARWMADNGLVEHQTDEP